MKIEITSRDHHQSRYVQIGWRTKARLIGLNVGEKL
jgi:hypothetical protein